MRPQPARLRRPAAWLKSQSCRGPTQGLTWPAAGRTVGPFAMVAVAQPLLYETHAHTPLCKHAVGEPEDYARAAAAAGLAGVVITCHCPLPDGLSPSVRMRPDEFPRYVAMVAEAREACAGEADVRLGLECDWLPGLEPWLDALLAREPFHHVLGSVHPQMPEWRRRFAGGAPRETQRNYFEQLALAAESRRFDTLSHPDLIKNEFPDTWELDAVLDDIRQALDRIAATGVAMELNTSGLNKALPEMNPGPRLLREIADRGIPMTIGADAHEPSRVGDRFVEALDLLAAAGFREVSWFLDRRRHTAPLDVARASLRR